MDLGKACFFVAEISIAADKYYMELSFVILFPFTWRALDHYFYDFLVLS